MRIRKRPDYIDLGIANTTESWKVALMKAADDEGNRTSWILLVAVLTLVVAGATLLVALLR